MPAAPIVTVTVNPALDVSFEVDQVIAERKLRCTRPVMHPGGGGINVARVALRLGQAARALWVGGGRDAPVLGDLLDHEQVPHERLPTRDELRRSLHVEERATGDMFRFVMPGAELTDDEQAHILDRVAALDGVAYVVLSGSLSPSLPVDFYARLAERCPREARVVLDTSGDPLARGLAGRIYLVKPNRNELSRMVGRELADHADLARAARELIDAGRVEVVAVSLAEDGLLLVTREGPEHVAAPTVEMVSAVGAGDSTVAGIVVGLARGMPLTDAARLGAAAGSAAVMTEATELCRPEDVARLFAELQAARPGT